MPNLMVYTPNLVPIDTIANYQNVRVTRNYRSYNVLELEPTARADIRQFATGNFIGIAERPGAMAPTRMYMIQQDTGDTQEDNHKIIAYDIGEYFTVRIVEPEAGQSHVTVTNMPAEEAMMYYVNRYAATNGATLPAVQIPRLVTYLNQRRGKNVTINARYQTLMDVLREICFAGDVGWEILYDHTLRRHEFTVLIGIDRSPSGVELSVDAGTASSIRLNRSITPRRDLAIVAGQKELAERVIRKRWRSKDTGLAEPTGFARREMFLDASDVSTEAGLDARGDSELAKNVIEDELDVDVAELGSFQYLRDFDLGDILPIRHADWNLSKQGRVVRVVLDWKPASDVPAVTVSVDKPYPTLLERLKQEKEFLGKARA